MRIKINRKQAEILTLKVMSEFGVSDFEMDNKTHVINLGNFELPKIKNFLQVLESQKDKKQFAYIKNTVSTFISILEGDKDAKMKNLDMFKDALINYMMQFKGYRIYKKSRYDSDIPLCYRVTRIAYEPPTVYHQAHTSMKMIFRQFGVICETSYVWHTDDVQGKSVKEILINSEFLTETEELRDSYLDSVSTFDKMHRLIGKQYLVTGVSDDSIDDENDDEDSHGRRRRSRWDVRKFYFENNKVVIDVFNETDVHKDEDEDSKINIGETFWANPHKDNTTKHRYSDNEEEDPENIEHGIEIPVHPYLVVFDLQRHMRLVVHYSYLTEYVYDENLSNKLVLTKNIKELIQALIEHQSGGFSDIIQGKTGGVIILLSGRAGTGKTLTAEVYAESKKKALYNVQASQLGIDPRELEIRLMRVLKRASRWGAILLIDEADVYVRERRNDLIQNAIVGVFLRILEYHSSMLFMTTNRPDTVDDAIMSRCIARIDYVYPSEEEQRMIWRILADTSLIKLSDDIIHKFVEKHHEYSGRDIKNLLKLGNLKAIGDKKDIDFEILDYVTRFNPTLIKK